jgi:hypothetical protein
MGDEGLGVCTDAPLACASDDACDQRAVCEGGLCVLPPPDRCKQSEHCLAGAICSGGWCVAVDGGGPADDAAVPDAAAFVEDAAVDGGAAQGCNDYDCCVNNQPVADGRACIKVAAKTCRGVCDDTLHEVVLEGACEPGVGRCLPVDGVEYERAVQCDVGACVPEDGGAGCVEAPMCGPISECSGHDDGQGCGAGLVDARCVGQMCARWAGSSPVDNNRVPLLDLAVHEVLDRFTVDGAVATGMVLTDTATHRVWTLPSEAAFGDLRAAHEYCRQLGTLGGGWRMPTWHEMASVLTVMRVGGRACGWISGTVLHRGSLMIGWAFAPPSGPAKCWPQT